MKKIFILLLLLPVTIKCNDSLTNAIKKSDPELVKKEIAKRISSQKPLTIEDQRFYLNFCDEVITRRRNAIQFPQYYEGRPIYTKAFYSDEEPSIPINCWFRGIIGLVGTMAALPYCFPQITDYSNNHNNTMNFGITIEVISLCLFISAAYEIEVGRKLAQEQLYENAVQIKHLFYDIVTA